MQEKNDELEVKEVKRRIKRSIITEYGVYYVYLENEKTNELFKIKTNAISEKDAEERAELVVDDVNVDVVKTVYAGAVKIPVGVISNALSLEESLSDIDRKTILEILRKANILLEVFK